MRSLRPFSALKSQAGQGLVEYALILILVAIVVVLVLTLMGGQLANIFQNITAAL